MHLPEYGTAAVTDIVGGGEDCDTIEQMVVDGTEEQTVSLIQDGTEITQLADGSLVFTSASNHG